MEDCSHSEDVAVSCSTSTSTGMSSFLYRIGERVLEIGTGMWLVIFVGAKFCKKSK